METQRASLRLIRILLLICVERSLCFTCPKLNVGERRPPQGCANHPPQSSCDSTLCLTCVTPRDVSPVWSLWNAPGSDSALCPQARLEVHRFGITGYGKGKERVLERERAIMLGAQVGGCFRLPASDRIQKRGKSPGQVRAWVTGRSLQNKKWYLFFFFLSFQPPKNIYVN